MQADAFGGCDDIYAGQAGGQVTEVACWEHAQRRFYEACTSDAAGSAQALVYIRLLYDGRDQDRHGGPLLPKSPPGEAITYALNQ